MSQPFVVFVDVDDTLILHVGSKRIPIPGTIRHVRELREFGATMSCWSTGGADYAREAAESVGVADGRRINTRTGEKRWVSLSVDSSAAAR